MDDGTRQGELFAEPGAEAGRAHALRADHGVPLEHERFDAFTGSLAGGYTSRRAAPDDEKLYVLHLLGIDFRAPADFSAWAVTGPRPRRAKTVPVVRPIAPARGLLVCDEG